MLKTFSNTLSAICSTLSTFLEKSTMPYRIEYRLSCKNKSSIFLNFSKILIAKSSLFFKIFTVAIVAISLRILFVETVNHINNVASNSHVWSEKGISVIFKNGKIKCFIEK